MTRPQRAPGGRRRHHGFTLIEMMISMVVAGLVMTGVYQLLIGQSRSYGQQRELMDVHQTLRSAGAMLAWEMRQLSAWEGDLSVIGENSITLRSVQGGGIVCARDSVLVTTGLGMTWGDLLSVAKDDSVMVFAADLDTWMAGKVGEIVPVIAPLPWCDWGGGSSIPPDLTFKLDVVHNGNWTRQNFVAFCVTLPPAQRPSCLIAPDWPTYCSSLTGAQKISCDAALAASTSGGVYEIGAPFRAFRRVEYALYADSGRWWLGRKVGGAGFYEKLIGPLLAPGSGGLVFTYRDAAGNVTADPTQVVVIDFVIRAESYRASGNALELRQDTLAVRVALRG